MINIIKPELLGNRLDADFYQKDFIGNELILSNFGSVTLSNLIDVKKSGYGVLPKSDEYLNNGLPLIRGGDLSFGRVQEIGVFVPEYYKDSRAIAKTGDVLILIKGACIDGPEGVARVGEAENGYLYNGSCYRLSFKQSELDGYFFIAYSQTKFFLKQKKRQVANTGISYNDESSILNYLIPNFTAIVKKYIGDKVRQAELLREWAKNIQNKATNILPVFKIRIADYKESYFKSSEIFSERLDSQFYHPNHIALENELRLNNCVKLSHFAKLIKQNWDKDKAQEFLYFEIGGLNISTGLIQPELINVNDAPSRAKTKVRYADVLVSTVRPNRKNVGFIAIDDPTVEMVATSGFSVLRFENPETAAFYHFWLRSDDATSQLMRWNSGSAYPAIDDDVPLNILVPKFEQHLIDEWGKKLLFAQLSYIYAQKLVGCAKFIVEALIEGLITEEELIQVQNALEQGDISLDRAILSQMTEDGYAVAGSKPLFSDLDEFYDLLEQAKALE